MGCGNSAPASDPNNNEKAKTQGSTRKTENKTGQPGTSSEDKERGALEELKQEAEIDDVNVPKTEPGYPPVKEPTEKKDEFFHGNKMKNIDEKARQTPPEKAKDYQELIAYLTEDCKTDVEKVRSIFIWMASQDIAKADYSSVTDSDTPMGLMKLMKDKRARYSTFFAVLCRHAKIPCVIIDGYAKSAAYEVGDTEEKIQTMNNSWNAVYVAGSWRFVFPLWACSCLVGHSSGTYTKVEAKGKAVREKEEEAAGAVVTNLDEYYFFTDPQEFIFYAFPKEKRWQLLSRPWNLQNYAGVPYCTRYFFHHDVEIKSKFSSRLKTKEGTCHVELTCKNPANMGFDYELFYNHKESGKEISSSLQLNNYVMLNRSDSVWDFGIRFPEIGIYKLQILGGRGYEVQICSVKIICNEVQEDCQPYPFNPGKIGYGPNPDTELAGIKAISHKTGVVKVFARKEIFLNFNLTRDITVKTELVHNTLSKEELSKYVKQTQKNRNVSVQVSVPENGEYALTMNAKQKNENEFKNVCNYLLTSEIGKKKRIRTWENPVEKRTRNNIQTMAKSNGTRDIEELELQLSKFEKLQMDDKGDLTAGHDALELKKLKKELEDAIKRRHLETLEKAIEHGNKSRFKDKVTKQITEAEETRDHLRHLDRIAHDVLEMKQPTIAELRSYKYPPPVIYDVMKSTFLMLGEKKEYLEDWEDIQILMGRIGKDSMLRRVKQFDTISVQPDTKYYVERTLNEHSETEVRLASAGAGTFYVWLRNVTKAMDQQDTNQTSG